jgi:glycosyltransferase involved in cell wall biosynthesis
VRSSQQPLRVLLIAPSLEITGGQSVQAARLLDAFRGLDGLQVDFLPLNASLRGILAPVARVPMLRTLVRSLIYHARLLRRVPASDVLHVFTASYWSYTLWTIPALAAAKLFGRPIAVNYRDGQAEDHLQSWRSALPTLRKVDAIVAPSGYLVEVFARYGLAAETIPNIIDPGRFRHRPRPRPRPVFLHNRMLDPLYNVPCTLGAFRLVQQRYPEASLTIAHDGPLRRELEQLVRDLGLRNCRFTGEVSQERMAQLYEEADIYLTSPNLDCMPGSLLECYAAGLPVVATAAGGIPHIARHEETALLVPVNDHRAMAQAALRLLEEPELAARLTSAAYQYCLQFAAEPVRRQWLALYRRMAGAAAPDAT